MEKREKTGVLLVALSFLIILVGCSHKQEDFLDFVNVNFTGVDSRGEAFVEIDQDALALHLNDVLGERVYFEDEDSIFSMVEIEIDKYENLSNGDRIILTVSVNQEYVDVFKETSSKQIDVKDLPEGIEINAELFLSNVEFVFSGPNGRGSVQSIIKNFDDDTLFMINYDVSNNGLLQNGEVVSVNLTKESLADLQKSEYILSSNFQGFEVSVSGLTDFAKSIEEINNLDEITDSIMNNLVSYESYQPDETAGNDYEMFWEFVPISYMYRPFEVKTKIPEVEQGQSVQIEGELVHSEAGTLQVWGDKHGLNGHGNILGLFYAERYIGKESRRFQYSLPVLIGYSNVSLNNGKGNLGDSKKIHNTLGHGFGIDKTNYDHYNEDIINIMEEYGYQRID